MEGKIILGAGLITLVLIIIYTLHHVLARPSFGHVGKRIRNPFLYHQQILWEHRIFRFRTWLYYFLLKFAVISKTDQKKFQRYVDRLNLKWGNEPLNPKFIRIDQYFFFIIWMLAGVILLSVKPLFGILVIGSSPIGYIAPVVDLKEKLDKKDRIIASEFSSFYSLVYYQFRKRNKMLNSVVREYLRNASPEMAFELKIFLNNLSRGEEWALIELRKRLPLKFIIRFCDVMKIRVTGVENISQMSYLKEEIHDEERHRIRRILEKRKKQANLLQSLVYLLLLQFIIVYWYLQLNDAGALLNK